jgi:hypothetical protein
VGIYRYGFNGQEKSDEIAGEGNHTTAEFWEYDTRTGKRWNVDPIVYPWQSPYAVLNNSPLYFVDPFGAESDPAAKRRAEKYQRSNGGALVEHGGETGGKYWSVDKAYSQLNSDGTIGLIGVDSRNFRSRGLDKVSDFFHSVGDWFSDANFVVEGGAKVDLGLQAKISGTAWGLKGTADVNVAKINLFTGKGSLNDPFSKDSWSYDYAGRDGVTISQGLALTAELPVKTPWGKIGVGGMVEQSFKVRGDILGEGDLTSHDYKTDYGVYLIVPVLQPKNMKQIADKVQSMEQKGMGMSKPPKISTKEGKNKKFYGIDVGVGAALFLGVDVNLKVGFNK